MLNVRGNLAAQLRIAQILQLNRDCHHVTILSNTPCPLALQTGQGRAGWVFWRMMNRLIHKSGSIKEEAQRHGRRLLS